MDDFHRSPVGFFSILGHRAPKINPFAGSAAHLSWFPSRHTGRGISFATRHSYPLPDAGDIFFHFNSDGRKNHENTVCAKTGPDDHQPERKEMSALREENHREMALSGLR
jgi:hypothetical protein